MFAKVIAVVRLSRVRYLALTIPPFIIGVIGSPSHKTSYLWIGIVQIVLLRSISSIGNCVSDRAEDAVDHPQRAELCRSVGYENLRRIVAAASGIYLALVVVLAVVLHTYWFAIFAWLLYLALKLSYSFGPRLKPRRFSATGLLGSLSAGMFAVGWIGEGKHDLQTTLVGMLLLWTMGSMLSGSKDVPNLEGDASIGYRSVYRDLIESSKPLGRALAKVSVPYVAAVVLFLAGFRAQVLWCLVVYPIAVGFVVVLVRARSELERSLVRECGYLYWLIFMGVTLTSLIPRASVAVVSLAGLGWYLLASRAAHPDPTPVNLRDMRRAAHILSRVSAQGS